MVATVVATAPPCPFSPVPSLRSRQLAKPLVAEARQGALRVCSGLPALGVAIALTGLKSCARGVDGRRPLGEAIHRVAPSSAGRLQVLLPCAQLPASPCPLPPQGPTPTAP